MVLRLLVFAVIGLTLLFLVVQVAIPAYHSRRLFPWFRRDRRKARVNLQEAKGRRLVAEDVLEAAQDAAGAAEMGKQRWVPTIQMGEGSGSGAGAASGFMQLMQVQAARQLNLDMKPR